MEPLLRNAWNRFFGRPSNARTEAANGVLKLRKRGGRGYGLAAFRALAIYSVARLTERPRFGEGWEKYAPIRQARARKEKPKRKRARARNPYQFPEMDWQALVEGDEALRPKPPEVQISIGLQRRSTPSEPKGLPFAWSSRHSWR